MADALPLAVTPVAPPPQLRDRLMETVRAEADVLSAAGPAADQPARKRAPRRSRSFAFSRPLALAGAAAALVLGVAVGFGVGSATNDEHTKTQTVVQVRTVQAAVDAARPRKGRRSSCCATASRRCA